MLHLLCHKEPLGTVFLQQDSNHVRLRPGYHLRHDTTKHGYSSVVEVSTGEWNGTLLSSAIRVGSVSMRVMDVHVYRVDLVSVIFRSTFSHGTQAPPQATWLGGRVSVTIAVTLGISVG